MIWRLNVTKTYRMTLLTESVFSTAIVRFFTTKKFSVDNLPKFYKKLKSNHLLLYPLASCSKKTTDKGKRISLNLSVESFFRDA